MVGVYDVSPSDLINALKEELKKNEKMKAPDWSIFAKSGSHKERPPQQPDFWYIRGASILRKVYTKGPIGVSRLRTEYGGKKNRGTKPERHRKASGSIVRELLQQLEASGYIQKGKKGRTVTPAGQKFLDNLSFKLVKAPKFSPEQKKKQAVVDKAKELVDNLSKKKLVVPKEEKPTEKKLEKPPEKKLEAPKEEKPAEKPPEKK